MYLKTIYLIRHGETDYNKKGIIQGSGIDAPLNHTGIKQAEAFYNYYKHLSFDKVYTSALKRTHQSVQAFLDDRLPHTVLPYLNEISWGSKEGLNPSEENKRYYAQLLKRWQAGEVELQVEDGESPVDVSRRLKKAMKHVLSQPDEKLILIAMHGRAMRILLAQLSGMHLSKMDRFKHQNLCVYKISYSYSTDKYTLLEENNVTHLEDLSI